MAGFKSIEAKAIISAVDGTGRVFSQIADKINKVTIAAKRLNHANVQGVESAGKMLARGREAESAMLRGERVLTRVNPVSAGARRGQIGNGALGRESEPHTGALHGAGAMDAGMAIAGGAGVAKALAKQSASIEHQVVRMQTAGMKAAEIDDAVAQSLAFSQTFKTTSQADILHMLRNARSIVGTFEEAAKIADPLMRLRTIAQGAHPEQAAALNEEFDKLIKGLEIKGVTQNMPAFKSYMDGMAKAVNVFGDTLRPTDFYEMFKYGRQSTTGLSQKYMLETAPTLAQELGGSSAGKANQAFFQAIVGGKMKDTAVKALNDIGLVDPHKVFRTKTGSIKGVMPGGVVGADLAAKNPYDWVNKILMPALSKNNITSKEDINKYIASIFSNATGAQLASIFATQQGRIEKDHKLVRGAEGLSAADRFMQSDPGMIFTGLKTQVDNLAASAGQPFLKPAITGLNSLSSALANLNQNLGKSPVNAAAAGGGAVAAAGAGTAIVGAGLLGSVGVGSGAGALIAGAAGAALPVTAAAGVVYLTAKSVESHFTAGGVQDEIIRLENSAAKNHGHAKTPGGMYMPPSVYAARIEDLKAQLAALKPVPERNLQLVKPQQVELSPNSKADVNVAVTVKVDASSSLINAAESARKATATANGSVRANLTGAGSNGRSTPDAGEQ